MPCVVDRHHGQGHADRPGHVFETVGGAEIGAAVVVDLVATAEAVPHVDAFHQVVENDRAVRLHFMNAPDLDRGGGRLGRLRAGGDRSADPAAMDHGPAERVAGMELVAEKVLLGLGLLRLGPFGPGRRRGETDHAAQQRIQQPCRSSFLDSFREGERTHHAPRDSLHHAERGKYDLLRLRSFLRRNCPPQFSFSRKVR